MKSILLFVTVLFAQVGSLAQPSKKPGCTDTTRYRFYSNISSYPELEIKVDGEWKRFQFLNETAETFDFECRETELNGNGSKELVIRWSNGVYGSGGGSITSGIQIWNLDKGTRLIEEITSCFEENFGRGEVKGYRVGCQKEIEILNQAIKVHEERCETESSENKDVSDPTLSCSLSSLEAGIYTFEEEKLIKKAN